VRPVSRSGHGFILRNHSRCEAYAVINTRKKPLRSPSSIGRRDRQSVKGGKRERARYSRYAKATFRKDRRLNIRLSSKDLEAIQKRALAEGLPYQTLISSLLHKYASGRLKEI
jgi:predicted DNA binding CopG/RHH family protein